MAHASHNPNTTIATLPANFARLFAYFELGAADEAALDAMCRDAVAQGATGVYLGDGLFRCLPHEDVTAQDFVLYRDPDMTIVTRPIADAERIRAQIAGHGLELNGLHFNQTLPPPGATVAWWTLRLERVLDVAAALGVRYLTTHPGWMYGAADPDETGQVAEAWQAGTITQTAFLEGCHEVYGERRVKVDSLLVYRELCRAAQARGMRVTLETAIVEWRSMTNDVARMRSFIDDVDADNLGFCIDPGHCQIQGLDPAAIARECGDLLWETHFHDNFGDRDSHFPIGIGTVNWVALITAMRDIGYAGDITFEMRDTAACAANWQRFTAAWERLAAQGAPSASTPPPAPPEPGHPATGPLS